MIIHVSSVYPPKLGGLEKVVETLSNTEFELGQGVSVISSNDGAVNTPHKDNFDVKRLRSFVFANTTIMPSLFLHLLKIKKTDIVHLHIARAYTPEMVWLVSKIKGFKYVAHVHLDIPPSGPAGFLLRLYKPLILSRVLRTARFVIVFTEDQKNEIHERYDLPLANIKVIPNGVGMEYYYSKPRSIHKVPRLLFVGRLSFQKNLQQLLKSLEGVSERFKLTLVGDGEQNEELQQLAKKLKLTNIDFVGRKDGEELLNYYRNSDIFVLPSEREGMPLVLLEAMAMGLPMVATDVTGSRDLVKDNKNGLLVPYSDVMALQKALIKLVSSSDQYKKLSAECRKLAEQYTWENVAKQCVDLYEKV